MSAPKWRRGAEFIMDPEKHSTPLDRNERYRILARCERMERATRGKGCRNGLLSRPALDILRTLLLRFAHKKTGVCFPSYDALQEATGYCRQTIATALQKLERAGVVRIVRRLKREVGELGGILCRQWSNLYSFSAPAKQLDLGPTTAPPRLPPKPRVHYIDGNPDQEVFNRSELASSDAFSPQAIQKRRAHAGLR